MSGLGLRAHVEVSILVGAHPHRVVSNGGGRSIGATRGTVRSLVSTNNEVSSDAYFRLRRSGVRSHNRR